MRRLLIAAAIAVCSAMTASAAPQNFAQSTALDKQPAEYARHTREHRMAEIEWNVERQERWRRRHYGHRDYYGPRYGGPPPWAPAYGYRRQYRDWDD
jgi:hypothetical protein